MGGIPNPCAGCGDPTCSCCIANSVDIAVLGGNGNQGSCFTLGIQPGAVTDHLCDEVVDGGNLVGGNDVLTISPSPACVVTKKTYVVPASACAQLNALPPAVGPALPGDEVVIFDGLTCVRKTITPSDCPPSPTPVFAPCVSADLQDVFCDPGTTTLKTLPKGITRIGDLFSGTWALNLFFLAQSTPFIIATSGIASITNDSCLYEMELMLVAEFGSVGFLGPAGPQFSVTVEENVNGGGFVPLAPLFSDYSGMVSPLMIDSRALVGAAEVYSVPPGGVFTYQWQYVVERIHPNAPNFSAIVSGTSGEVAILGASA